jgi:nitrogen fixation/metabolism regulation signal transduction histidine kinase
MTARKPLVAQWKLYAPLVNEFAALASFPTAQPEPSDINSLIESSLAMFNGRLDGINVHTQLANDLPKVMADSEAIRRRICQFVDNAAEAMQDVPLREINISTSLVNSGEAVEIAVADTGPGSLKTSKKNSFFLTSLPKTAGQALAWPSLVVSLKSITVPYGRGEPAHGSALRRGVAGRCRSRPTVDYSACLTF